MPANMRWHFRLQPPPRALLAVLFVMPVASAWSADWTSFYLGTDVAAGQVYSHAVRNSADALFPVGFVSSIVETGAAGGVTAGADYQLKWLVVGVTGSWQGTGIGGTSTSYSPQIKGVYLVAQRDTDWLADAGGRVGVALERWLFYGKGGAAWRRHDENATNSTYDQNGVLITESQSQPITLFGYVVGGGIEWQPAEAVSVKVEFDWFNFGTPPSEATTCIAGKCGSGTPSGLATTYPTVGEVKVGVNLHLDWPQSLAHR